MHDFRQPGTPGLWRLAAAARAAGMAPELFEAASKSGDIPVAVMRIGPRGLKFVRAAELQEFLAGRTRETMENDR